jgi:hypothetical protein
MQRTSDALLAGDADDASVGGDEPMVVTDASGTH